MEKGFLMNYYTVNSLKDTLDDLIAQGQGDKYIVISSDEEGNHYRVLVDQAVLMTKRDIEEYLGDDATNEYHLPVMVEDCVVL